MISKAKFELLQQDIKSLLVREGIQIQKFESSNYLFGCIDIQVKSLSEAYQGAFLTKFLYPCDVQLHRHSISVYLIVHTSEVPITVSFSWEDSNG